MSYCFTDKKKKKHTLLTALILLLLFLMLCTVTAGEPRRNDVQQGSAGKTLTGGLRQRRKRRPKAKNLKSTWHCACYVTPRRLTAAVPRRAQKTPSRLSSCLLFNVANSPTTPGSHAAIIINQMAYESAGRGQGSRLKSHRLLFPSPLRLVARSCESSAWCAHIKKGPGRGCSPINTPYCPFLFARNAHKLPYGRDGRLCGRWSSRGESTATP